MDEPSPLAPPKFYQLNGRKTILVPPTTTSRDITRERTRRLPPLPMTPPALSAVRLTSISMVSVLPREELGLPQQEVFINDQIEDITRRQTLILSEPFQFPAELAIPSAQQALTEKRRAVTSTAGGAALAGIGDLISSVLRYITNVAMTHIVARALYGIFVETSTVATVVGYAAKLGLDSAALHFLSTYRTKGEQGLAAGVIRFAASLTIISGLICAALFYFSSAFLAHAIYHQDVYELPFKEVTLLIPLVGMQLVVASGLQALKAIKWKVYVDRLIQPALTLVLLVVFYLLGLKLEALILATICGYLASAIAGQILLSKGLKKLVANEKPHYDPGTWMRFAFPMFFNSMIRTILNSTDILFLGALAATAQVGLYGAADRVSYFVVAPLLALNVIFSPIIAEYHTRGKYRELASMFKVVTKWSFSLSLPIFLCCLIFHDTILGVFGGQYIGASLVLILLALGNLVDSSVGPVNYLLMMTGRAKIILVNSIVTVVVNVTLALVLIPRFDIVGAAVAAALTVVILNSVGLIEVYCLMKMQPYRWDILKPLVAGGVASLVGFALMQFIHGVHGYGYLAILGALGLIIPFVLVYILMLALMRFSEEDLMVFDTVRAKFSKKKAVSSSMQ